MCWLFTSKLYSLYTTVYSALWCWAWDSANHSSALPLLPLGSANRRSYRETGGLEEGEGTGSYPSACSSSHLGWGSWFWLQLLLVCSEPSYLLRVTSTSQVIPPPRSSESRFPDSVRSFLWDPELTPPGRPRPFFSNLSASSEATFLSSDNSKLFPPDPWFSNGVSEPIVSLSPGKC